MTDDKNPIRDFAAELRQELGQEVREEAAEDEQLTELLRERKTTMAEHVADLAHRGARVAVQFGGHAFGGAVVASGEDYASVAGPGQRADISLRSSIWTEASQPIESTRLVNPPNTFRGILHASASGDQMLRFAMAGGEILIGKIAVVAEDHLRIDDAEGQRRYVPAELVLGIIRATEFQ